MNYLILGGNGYIGSKITRELYQDGHTVVCTKRVSSDVSRLDDLSEVVRWIPASVDAIESVVQFMKIDCVLNLVCNYGKTNVLYDGVIEANIEFPLKVLNTVVGHGIKKFLTIGTGLPDNLNMYSFSKKVLNEFGKYYVEKHGIDYNCLKLEMFYGADEPVTRFIPATMTKMINGDIVETTIGTQKRDIISVSDTIKAIKMVLYSNVKGYNEIPVGTGYALRISEIVDYIWMQTGCKSEVCKGAIPMRNDESDCVADTTFLRTLGEWNPIPWTMGLDQMIQQMRNSKVKA